MNQNLQMILMFIITVFSCTIAEGVKTTSQEDKPVNTRDALKGIIGDSNTPEEPSPKSLIDALKGIIGDSNTPEEPSPKSLIDALKGIIGDTNTPEEPNEAIEKIPGTGTAQSGKPLQKAGEEDSGTLYELGKIYLEGSGDIARDVTKALELLTKSAELGNGNAMVELAYIYQRGDDADRDPQKTLEWLHKAAEAGKGIAMLALANVVSEGQDPNINEEQRMEWVRKGLNSLE